MLATYAWRPIFLWHGLILYIIELELDKTYSDTFVNGEGSYKPVQLYSLSTAGENHGWLVYTDNKRVTQVKKVELLSLLIPHPHKLNAGFVVSGLNMFICM